MVRVAGTGASNLTDGAIDSAVGHTNWYRLANVTVANGAVSIVNANISNVGAMVTIGKDVAGFRHKFNGDASGLFGILTNPMNATLLPDTDNLRDIGSLAARIKNIYGVDIYASFFHGDGSALTNLSIQNLTTNKIAGENLAIRDVVALVPITESFGTGTSERNVAYDSTVTKVAQGFQIPVSQSISQISLNIKKVGTPASNLRVEIFSDSAGNPNASLGSADIPVANVPSAYADVIVGFSTPIALTANTQYHIVLSRVDGSTNTSNYYMWQGDTAGGYSYGQTKIYSGSAWSADGTRDCRFAVYYTGVKKADQSTLSLSKTLGFVVSAFNARVSGIIQALGEMGGFTLAKYQSTTESQLFINSSATNTSFGPNWSSGTRTERQYFTVDEVGIITAIEAYLGKNGTGNDLTAVLYKSDEAGAYNLLATVTFLASSITSDGWYKQSISPIEVNGGGEFYIEFSGTGTGTNYTKLGGRSSGDSWPFVDNGASPSIKDIGIAIDGLPRKYIVGAPVYLQTSGAISYKPEGNYSSVVGRVIDHSTIEINPPAPNRLIGKIASWGSYGGSVAKRFATVPPQCRKIIAEIVWYNYSGGTSGTVKEIVVMERPGAMHHDFASGNSGTNGVTGSIDWTGDVLTLTCQSGTTEQSGDIYFYA